MKNLFIALSVVSSLLVGQSVMAQEPVVDIAVKDIETVVVVSKPEVANFEIYSLELAETAIDSIVDMMADSVSASLSAAGNRLASTAVTAGSSI